VVQAYHEAMNVVRQKASSNTMLTKGTAMLTPNLDRVADTLPE